MEDSIFAKFARGDEKPGKVFYEDQDMIAFDNLYPKTPIHILIIPKKPIASIADLEEGDELIVGKMIWRAKILAEELGIAESGYRLAFNVREHGGQSIPYLHLHLLGGARLQE